MYRFHLSQIQQSDKWQKIQHNYEWWKENLRREREQLYIVRLWQHSKLTNWLYGCTDRTWKLGKANWVCFILFKLRSWFGKCLEISPFSISKRWWSFSSRVIFYGFYHWITVVFRGIVYRTIRWVGWVALQIFHKILLFVTSHWSTTISLGPIKAYSFISPLFKGESIQCQSTLTLR